MSHLWNSPPNCIFVSCLLLICLWMEALVHETIVEFHIGKQQRFNLMSLHYVTVIQAVQEDV